MNWNGNGNRIFSSMDAWHYNQMGILATVLV